MTRMTHWSPQLHSATLTQGCRWFRHFSCEVLSHRTRVVQPAWSMTKGHQMLPICHVIRNQNSSIPHVRKASGFSFIFDPVYLVHMAWCRSWTESHLAGILWCTGIAVRGTSFILGPSSILNLRGWVLTTNSTSRWCASIACPLFASGI
jgi:hypothetical protein